MPVFAVWCPLVYVNFFANTQGQSGGGTIEENEFSGPFASGPLSSRPPRIILVSRGMATFFLDYLASSYHVTPRQRYPVPGTSAVRSAFVGTASLPGSGELAVPENEFGRDRYASKPTLHLQKGSGHPDGGICLRITVPWPRIQHTTGTKSLSGCRSGSGARISQRARTDLSSFSVGIAALFFSDSTP